MLRLFAIENSRFSDDGTFEKYLALTDGARRGKIEKLTVREKKNQSLAAGVILPLSLKGVGYTGSIEIGYGENGKPRFIQPEGLYFNLSHSGEWTVAALSDCEAGCDIQKVSPADMRLADRFFSAEEREALALAGDGAQDLFFRIWTVKESYLKALGTGLSRPLGSFSVRFTENGIVISDPYAAQRFYAVEANAPSGYKIACCTAEPHSAPELEILTV